VKPHLVSSLFPSRFFGIDVIFNENDLGKPNKALHLSYGQVFDLSGPKKEFGRGSNNKSSTFLSYRTCCFTWNSLPTRSLYLQRHAPSSYWNLFAINHSKSLSKTAPVCKKAVFRVSRDSQRGMPWFFVNIFKTYILMKNIFESLNLQLHKRINRFVLNLSNCWPSNLPRGTPFTGKKDKTSSWKKSPKLYDWFSCKTNFDWFSSSARILSGMGWNKAKESEMWVVWM